MAPLPGPTGRGQPPGRRQEESHRGSVAVYLEVNSAVRFCLDGAYVENDAPCAPEMFSKSNTASHPAKAQALKALNSTGASPM